jgi:hypothetical protein
MTTSSLSPFPSRFASLIACICAVMLAGCDSPESTIREIRENLSAFQRQPNIITLDTLDKSFKKIDAQILDLEARERIDEADLYRRQAMLMREEYRQTRINFLKWSQRQSRSQSESQ